MPGPLFANLPTGGDAETAAAPPPGDGPPEDVPPAEGEPASPPEGDGEFSPPPPDAPGDGANAAESSAIVGTLATVPGRRRPARYGLLVQFESRPDDAELGRLVDSTIWINDAHPAYVRAAASRSSGYHIALTVALALAPLAVGPAGEHGFITQFLAHWGGTRGTRPRRTGSRRA